MEHFCCQLREIVTYNDFHTLRKKLTDGCLTFCSNECKCNCFHHATQAGYKHTVQILIRAVQNIDIQNADGYTALMIAVQHRNVDIALTLLKSGARIDISNGAGKTALMIALENSFSTEFLKILLDRGSNAGINLQDSQGETAVMKAVLNKDMDAVILLTGLPLIDLNIRDHKGRSVADIAELFGLGSFLSLAQDLRRTDDNTPLILAVMSGLSDEVSLLLTTCCMSPNSPGSDGNTPLMIAACLSSSVTENVNIDITKSLLQAGANVNEINQFNGYTALMCAVKHSSIELVSCLLQSGANVNIKSKNNVTPLMLCLELKRDDCICLLFQHGLNLTSTEVNMAMTHGSYDLFLAYGDKIISSKYSVAVAVEKNNMGLLTYLLEKGLSVDEVHHGKTALICAVKSKNVEMVRYLLDQGASVDQGDLKICPLREAVLYGDLAIVKLLLQHGANPDFSSQSSKEPLLCFACANGRFHDVAIALIESGANVNASYTRPPLHIVASKGDTHLLELLLKHGADISALDTLGDTVVHAALQHPQALNLLLENGANIDTILKRDVSLLHNVINCGLLESLKILLGHGANIHTRDQHGRTIFLHTVRAKTSLIKTFFNFLLTQKVNVNDTDEQGISALHFIVGNTALSPKCRAELVKTLILHGANTNLRDNLDETVLHVAVKYHLPDVVRILIENGADLQSPRGPRRKSVLVQAISSFVMSSNSLETLEALMNAGAKTSGIDSVFDINSKFVSKYYEIIALGLVDLAIRLTQCGMPPCNVRCWRVLVHLAQTGVSSELIESLSRCGPNDLISPLAMALLTDQLDIAEYFINNWYFTRLDLTMLHKSSFLDLVRKYCSNGIISLLNNFIMSQPKSLVALSFVSVSDHLGHGSQTRENAVTSLGLPRIITNRLLFQNSTSNHRHRISLSGRKDAQNVGLDEMD